jgi:hypothetical protein
MPHISRPVLLLATVLVAGCATPRRAGEPEENPLARLSPGWNSIEGGTGTGCALDTNFTFFVRPGDPKRFVFYLQGGGACWNGENCDVRGRPTFDPTVDSTDFPAAPRGLASLENESNPVRGFSMVFVPYCTGDVHLGTRTVSYTSRGTLLRRSRTYEIHHWGATNVSHVLAWTYRAFRDPEVIFVSGSSAGAIPSPLYAAQLAAHYPRARVVQLGDAAGGYRSPEIARNLKASGVLEFVRRTRGFESIDSANFSFEELYTRAARVAPRAMFSQFNNVEDSTQMFFLRQLGYRERRLAPLLAANLSDIRRANPRFRSYTAPGATHTVLGRPQFYTLTVDGVRFRDWLAGLLDGKTVPNVGDGLLIGNGR